MTIRADCAIFGEEFQITSGKVTVKRGLLSMLLAVILLAAAPYAPAETGEKTLLSVPLRVEYGKPTADGRFSA